MNDNPYALTDGIKAFESPAAVRAAFLTRVYGLVLAGVLTFAATMWAAGTVPAVRDMMEGLWSTISGTRFGWLVYMGIFMGGFYLVHALAERKPLNIVLYFGWTFLLGLLTAPLALAVSADTLNAASAITMLIFTGLTAIVLVTGKDFSFLRGILMLGFWTILVLIIASFFWPVSQLWMSGLIAALMAGYILYDTSNVLHRYSTNQSVTAAIVLFTDVVLLFKHILIMLSSRD